MIRITVIEEAEKFNLSNNPLNGRDLAILQEALKSHSKIKMEIAQYPEGNMPAILLDFSIVPEVRP